MHLPRWAEPKVTKEVDEIDASLSANHRVEYRKQVIHTIVTEQGNMPSYRVLARLMQERGIQVSHVQVMTYCRQMTLPKPALAHPLLLTP